MSLSVGIQSPGVTRPAIATERTGTPMPGASGNLNGREVHVGEAAPPRQAGLVDSILSGLVDFAGGLFHERTRQADAAQSIASVLATKLESVIVGDFNAGINRAAGTVDGDRFAEIHEAIAEHPAFFLNGSSGDTDRIGGLPPDVAARLLDHVESVLADRLGSAPEGQMMPVALGHVVKALKAEDLAHLGVTDAAGLRDFGKAYATALDALATQFAIEDGAFPGVARKTGSDERLIEQARDYELLSQTGNRVSADEFAAFYGAAEAVVREAASEGVMGPVIALQAAEKLLSADEIRAGLARSPMLQAALQGTTVAPEVPKPNALRQNLVLHDDRTGTDTPFDDTRRPDMAARIDRAWAVIQTLFEPDRLDQAMADRPVPQVLVHSKGAYLGGLIGTRANYDDSTNQLHLAHNDPVEVIVHEFCHYLEESLPFDALGGTKHLLEDRAQGSRDLSNIFGPVMTDERMYSEGGTAFGRYGQKYYREATEVLSMGGEYLSDPRTARQLVEQDPGLALMLLRVMRPTEYAQVMEHMLAGGDG